MIQSKSGLQTIHEQLRDERTRLQGQLETARRTVQHLEAEVDRVDHAMAALRGEVSARTTRGRKRALTGAEVGMLIEQILAEEGRQTEKKLKEKISERVAAQGRSRQGIHLRFKKVLQDGPFQFNGAHWELKV